MRDNERNKENHQRLFAKKLQSLKQKESAIKKTCHDIITDGSVYKTTIYRRTEIEIHSENFSLDWWIS